MTIAIWDSGVDTKLFPGQLALDAAASVPLIAFDRYSNRRKASSSRFPTR